MEYHSDLFFSDWCFEKRTYVVNVVCLDMVSVMLRYGDRNVDLEAERECDFTNKRDKRCAADRRLESFPSLHSVGLWRENFGIFR